MKTKKYEVNIPDDMVITVDNVQYLGEMVAIASLKYLMRCSGHALDSLYRGLLKDVFRPLSIYGTFANGYDIAQEAACYLCNHIGRPLNDITRIDRNGHPITIRRDCFRVAFRYIENERAVIYHTERFDDQFVSEMETDIETLTRCAADIVDELMNRMKLTPYEEDTLHCYMSGMGISEISNLLGVPASTTWRRRKRIQKKYFKYIDPDMECRL